MSPPLGEEINARNSPGVPLPVLFGVLALILIVPTMYNVVRSAFAWEPAPAPTIVVDGRTLFVTQPVGCDDHASCPVSVRFDNTTYESQFDVTGPLGEPLAVQPNGTMAATTVPGVEGNHEWATIDFPGHGWVLARSANKVGTAFPADVVCPSVVVTQEADCRAAAAGR